MSSLKAKLKAKSQRKVIRSVTLDGEAVDLCRPTHPERLDVFAASKAAGEIDEDNKPLSLESGLKLMARVVASVMREPHTGERVFDPGSAEDLATIFNAPWFEDLDTNAVMAAFRATVEDVRKNS
ncbi:hypothetical protein [Myxococcus landrumensis]|uniref:Phage tail protein n=1 Tax=Myxococcus landrumensis TaxID=2813577 RepID=A0ABX7NEI8_9BACT|nr:hypothetical protein [Myxococcus landrumus]QSQ17237.1 hypothetical protein JY572_14750 [Myxococcus landrumus]